jgi:hypothetical protein
VESLPFLLIGGLVVAAVWYASLPPIVFVVRVVGGEPRAVRGKVSGPFLDAVAEMCRQHGITAGTVTGVAHGQRIALRFSSGIPEACRQQLRNWWSHSGWPAPQREVRRKP